MITFFATNSVSSFVTTQILKSSKILKKYNPLVIIGKIVSIDEASDNHQRTEIWKNQNYVTP